MNKMLMVLLLTLLVGCSLEQASKPIQRPSNIRSEVWERGIEYTASIHNAVMNKGELPEGLPKTVGSYSNKDRYSPPLNQEEERLVLLVRSLGTDSLQSVIWKKEPSKSYLYDYEKLVEIFGEANLERDMTYNSATDTASSDTKDESPNDLFEQLEISNVSIDYDSNFGWYSLSGEITNHFSKRLNGYIRVALYDDQGDLVDSSLISIPGTDGLEAGATSVFDETVSQKEFATYKFFDETVVISK